MPKKESKQLNTVVGMLADALTKGPITTERKKAILKDITERFTCSDKTAYYYYFYKAMKLLQSDGMQVMAVKSKATKRVKTAKTTSELIADLPKGMIEQMKAGNPFAQLMTA